MAISVYVHIPYCLQRCRYCDFATFEQSEIEPPEQYVESVKQEIRKRHAFWSDRQIATLYFGGGTPSLLAPELIVALRQELANAGFEFLSDAETTIEINPATLSEDKLEQYLKAGFNRFSVGAQTFNDSLLKMCGRKHSATDTRQTLRQLQKYNLNYSFDLLFALPGQTLGDLKLDLQEVIAFAPPHLSAYCLTVPEGHSMSAGRPPEDDQLEMFQMIEVELRANGLQQYEISNFARPGFESRHNLAYWRDVSYWGIGLSSHSYMRDYSQYGMRFWNPSAMAEYARQSQHSGDGFAELLPTKQREILSQHESLTDFCHMFLRTEAGLPEAALRRKFPPEIADLTRSRIDNLVARGLIRQQFSSWSLSERGRRISNQVFGELTLLPGENR